MLLIVLFCASYFLNLTKYINSSLCGGQIELTIGQNGFVINQKLGCSIHMENFEERDSLNKNTGVTFPEYKVVNYHEEGGWLDYTVTYYLLLDKKPSRQFIKQLEDSPRWTKNEDGTYSCEWGKYNNYSEGITIDKNSRVIKAIYASW